jgi:hypothetical protein
VIDRFGFISRLRLGRRQLSVGIIFLAVICVSLAFFFMMGDRRGKRVLFFPADQTGGLVAEERFLPNRGNVEMDLEELVNGVILGPVNHDSSRLLPRDTTVRVLFLRGRILYLDLSADVVLAGREYPLRGEEALAALRKTIIFNFPRVREVFFLVDGQIPNFGEKKKIH